MSSESVIESACDDTRSDFVIYKDQLVRYTGTSLDVVIPNGITMILPDAFAGYANLHSVVIPDSVTIIFCDAFHDCTALTDITIPKNVTYIGDGAFFNCRNLRNLTILNENTQIETLTVSDYCGADLTASFPYRIPEIQAPESWKVRYSGAFLCLAPYRRTAPPSVPAAKSIPQSGIAHNFRKRIRKIKELLTK